MIDTLSSYLDSASIILEESGRWEFYYTVEVKAGNYTRNSFIYNYTDFISPTQIYLDTSNVSTDKDGYIKITWDPIIGIDTTYFYQYEIWRKLDEEISDTSIVAIIPDPKVDHFLDRNVGNGTTWYYSVVIVDINGRKDPSYFISGWSMP